MYASPRQKAVSALAAFAIVLLLTLALASGLRVRFVAHGTSSLVSILIAPARPPEPKMPQPKVRAASSSVPKGAPAPRNLRGKATEVFAPRLPPLIVPPPIVTATRPAAGEAAASGASDMAGPGQGAGGMGQGTGGGGEGGDGGDGVAIGPRQTGGKLSFRDLPEGLIPPGGEARVGVRYAVEVDGRVHGCRVDEPSGIPELDALACRLIEQRFRFRPARDRAGRPVRATIVEAHSWFVREEGD